MNHSKRERDLTSTLSAGGMPLEPIETASVDELLINIDTEFAIEEAKLDERTAEVDLESSMSLDELLDDKTDVSNTLSDIDKLLQEEGGGE